MARTKQTAKPIGKQDATKSVATKTTKRVGSKPEVWNSLDEQDQQRRISSRTSSATIVQNEPVVQKETVVQNEPVVQNELEDLPSILRGFGNNKEDDAPQDEISNQSTNPDNLQVSTFVQSTPQSVSEDIDPFQNYVPNQYLEVPVQPVEETTDPNKVAGILGQEAQNDFINQFLEINPEEAPITTSNLPQTPTRFRSSQPVEPNQVEVVEPVEVVTKTTRRAKVPQPKFAGKLTITNIMAKLNVGTKLDVHKIRLYIRNSTMSEGSYGGTVTVKLPTSTAMISANGNIIILGSKSFDTLKEDAVKIVRILQVSGLKGVEEAQFPDAPINVVNVVAYARFGFNIDLKKFAVARGTPSFKKFLKVTLQPGEAQNASPGLTFMVYANGMVYATGSSRIEELEAAIETWLYPLSLQFVQKE